MSGVKKIVVVNAGPRKGWNTDTLLQEAAKGAEDAGALIEKFDLFRLERYMGCISCQLKDYSQTDWPWTMFDPKAKKERHDTVFPEERKTVYEMGKAMINS